jgi:hypothetical protein
MVDMEQDGDMLTKFGIDPSRLLGEFDGDMDLG